MVHRHCAERYPISILLDKKEPVIDNTGCIGVWIHATIRGRRDPLWKPLLTNKHTLIMRKRALSLRALLPTCTIVLAVLLACVGKAYSKYYATAWFKSSAGNCTMGTAPSGCSAINSGVICTINGNNWFTSNSCTSPLYLRE